MTYGQDQATRANAGNTDDNKDEVCEEDNVDVNVGSHLVNEPIMDDFIDDMSLTPQSHVVPQKVEYALSSSTNRYRKRKKMREQLIVCVQVLRQLLKLW